MPELMIPTDEERTWAALSHLSGLFAPVIGPLLILLIYHDRSRFVRYHGLQAVLMNVMAVVAALGVGSVIAVISLFTCGIGAILYLGLALLALPLLASAWVAWQGRWETLPVISAFGAD